MLQFLRKWYVFLPHKWEGFILLSSNVEAVTIYKVTAILKMTQLRFQTNKNLELSGTIKTRNT